VLALTLAAPAMAWDLDELNRRADENLMQLGDGCSATLVDVEARLVLTAYHCVGEYIANAAKPLLDENGEPRLGPDGKPLLSRKTATIQVPLHQFFWDDKGKKGEVTYMADIVARDAKRDVAFLKVPAKVGPVAIDLSYAKSVPLGSKDSFPRRGSTVWHIGNPKMVYGTVTRGIVSSKRAMAEFIGNDDVKFHIQYDGGLTNGSSGGALYDDDGTYIGVAVMVYTDHEFMGFAVPMSEVWAVAADNCIAADLGGEDAAKCKYAPEKVGQP
jgi:S1-C subfamily serine protease